MPTPDELRRFFAEAPQDPEDRAPLIPPEFADLVDKIPHVPGPHPSLSEDCLTLDGVASLWGGEDDDLLGDDAPVVTRADRIRLSDDQEQVFSGLHRWATDPSMAPNRVTSLGGYAGTGKSTIITRLLREFPRKRIAVAAYTGRAVQRLRGELATMGVRSSRHRLSTLHSLLYGCWVDERTGALLTRQKTPEDFEEFDFIIIDEASMVGARMVRDLIATGRPLLFVGDHGQLDPVMDRATILMKEPDYRLERIHRQAEGNAILALSKTVRELGDLPSRPHSEGAVRFISVHDRNELREILSRGMEPLRAKDDFSAFGFLVGVHKTRLTYTPVLRAIHHRDPDLEHVPRSDWVHTTPLVGDLVLCGKNALARVWNGMRGKIESLKGIEVYPGSLPPDYPNPYAPNHPHAIRARVRFPQEGLTVDGPVFRHGFGRTHLFDPKKAESLKLYTDLAIRPAAVGAMGLFLDFGYALTVQKAQGSQFDDVVVVYERNPSQGEDSFRRWLYTAITRASKTLTVVLPERGSW